MMQRIPVTLDLSTMVAQPLKEGGGFTWTLASSLGRMLREAETQFGERDKCYTILGVEFVDSHPQLWYPGGCGNIVVQISLDCLSDPRRAYYQLAHEALHLLSPTGGNHSNCLEEGLATAFSAGYMARYYSGNWSPGLLSYQRAASAVESLLAGRPDVIKALRQSEPVISRITSGMILSACPDFDPGIAEYLGGRFLRG